MRLTLAAPGIALTAIFISAAALLSPGSTSAADPTIDAGNNYFCSASFDGSVCETDVTAGDIVTWDVSAGTHTINQCADGNFTGCTSGFDSGIVSAPATFSQTFGTPGTYYYRCNLHPSEMLGKIVVAAAATAAPAPTAAPSSTDQAATAAPAGKTAVALPSTGGPPGDSSSGSLAYGLLSLAGLLFGAALLSIEFARRR